METGFEAGVGMLGVHPIGRGHQDGLKAFFLGQEFTVVLVDINHLAVLFEIALGVLTAVFPDVADGPDADSRDAQAGFDQDPALGAGTDDGDIQFRGIFLGGDFFRSLLAAERRPADGHPQTRRSGRPQKVSPGN